MDDYIDRQVAIDIVVFECDKWTGLAKEISKQLKQLPAADVAPVVHGRWIDADFCGQYECSECGNNAVDLYDFCPNCGAKMDAQREE